MSRLPALPDDPIDSDAREVAFVMHQCRGCGAESEWYRCDTDAEQRGWDGDHARLGKEHSRFYLFRLIRNTSRVRFM